MGTSGCRNSGVSEQKLGRMPALPTLLSVHHNAIDWIYHYKSYAFLESSKYREGQAPERQVFARPSVVSR